MTTRTESSKLQYRDLERFPTGKMLDVLLQGQGAALTAVSAALPDLEKAVTLAAKRLAKPSARLIYAGAGTSGRMALLDGVELFPTFGWPEERLVTLLAGGDASVAEAREGAEDDEDEASVAIAVANCGPDDVLLALAASGTTPYTLAAVRAARERGALTIGFANNPGSPLLEEAENAILLDTGAEVLAGSTRMAAGTSQKIALNMFSTAVMVRLGKVYRGQMVDMKAANKKLVRRAIAMVTNVSGCDEDAARQALEKTGFHVKPAVLVVHGLSAAEAEAALERHQGDLHRVFAELGKDG